MTFDAVFPPHPPPPAADAYGGRDHEVWFLFCVEKHQISITCNVKSNDADPFRNHLQIIC